MKKMSIKREALFMMVMVKVRRRTRESSEETVPEEHKELELVVIVIPSWRVSTQRWEEAELSRRREYLRC